MEKQKTEIGGRDVLLYQTDAKPRVLLIQTLGKQERGSIDGEVQLIREAVSAPFVMAAFAIDDWEVELTPWHDPEVSRRKEVGEHAGETLQYVTDILIPSLKKEYGDRPVILGGYSLGGLFARWAASERDAFSAVACCSPSVWIAGWRDYSASHPVLARNVYLSLGDREEFSKNKAIAQVGAHIRWEYAHLQQTLGDDHCTIEWNPGNHFMDGALRTAKGFAWCISKASAIV
ncbi:MAG: esterase [Bacteroidales bacterium]|nr:esterase [Bacteroidales bacterium]